MYRVKWSPLVGITTIAISIVFLYVNIVQINGVINSDSIVTHIIIIFILDSVIIGVIMNIPLYINIDENCITVKKMLGKIQINYSEIICTKSFNPAADLRIFGSGGFGGFLGKFSNSEYGWYSSYVCNPKQSFMVSVKNNKKYAFSCDDSVNVVKLINEYI